MIKPLPITLIQSGTAFDSYRIARATPPPPVKSLQLFALSARL
jgi:hypothetical protein